MGIESGSTNRWKTARERNRLKARFEIHASVAELVQMHMMQPDNSSGEQIDNEQSSSTSATTTTAAAASLDEVNIILSYLQAIIKNDVSTFSVTSLARHHQCNDIRQYNLVNGPLPNYDHSKNIDNDFDSATFDLSGGLPKNGAANIEQAKYALQLMLSTNIPWQKHDDQLTIKLDIHQQSQPATLATSKYSRNFVAKRLIPYMNYLHRQGDNLTLMEYASLVGRHQIVGLLMLGGFDPTRRIKTKDGCCSEEDIVNEEEAAMKDYERAGQMASRKVLSFFHGLHVNDDEKHEDGFDNGWSVQIPMSIWQYMIRAVVEMRMNGALLCVGQQPREKYCSLPSCNLHSHPLLLNFGPPCFHSFCEPCIWVHFLQHVPYATDLKSTLVTCPKCSAPFEGFQFCEKGDDLSKSTVSKNDGNDINDVMEEKKDDAMQELSVVRTSTIQLREQRRVQSYSKFMTLPATSTELKLQSRQTHTPGLDHNQRKVNTKRRKEKDPIHSTWEEALEPMIEAQLSRDVRSDRFFRAVASSSVQLVIAYLNAGIDVNMQNEYGQTPLYVACWKGSTDVVQWLLHFGADPKVCANGGSTCWSVARRFVLELLLKYGYEPISLDKNICPAPCRDEDNFEVTMLIDEHADHPGAGACIVDNALSEEQLSYLYSLQQSLPVIEACDDDVGGQQPEDADGESNSEKYNYRPSRSYYCDVDREIQKMLEGCITAARQSISREDDEHEKSSKNSPTSVFQNIRFLKYERKGGVLPPHVDLCRVDEKSGQRSTHTFILYLTDCEEGGGTALLEHLKTPKVLAVAQPKRGRALIFPHNTPHSGLEVDCVPKVLLRGEVIL